MLGLGVGGLDWGGEGKLASSCVRLLPALARGCRDSCAACGCWGGIDSYAAPAAEVPGHWGCRGDVELLAGWNDGDVMLLGGAVGFVVLLSAEMPLAVPPDAHSWVVLVCRASLGRENGDGRAYPLPAAHLFKVLDG